MNSTTTALTFTVRIRSTNMLCEIISSPVGHIRKYILGYTWPINDYFGTINLFLLNCIKTNDPYVTAGCSFKERMLQDWLWGGLTYNLMTLRAMWYVNDTVRLLPSPSQEMNFITQIGKRISAWFTGTPHLISICRHSWVQIHFHRLIRGKFTKCPYFIYNLIPRSKIFHR